MKKTKTSVVFTGDIGFDRYMDKRWEDEKLISAAAMALSTGKITTAMLQRRLQIGYGRAAKILDKLCALGIISAPDGTKPRLCMITVDENNKVSRINEAWLEALENDESGESGETDGDDFWKILDMALLDLDKSEGEEKSTSPEPESQIARPYIDDELIADAARLAAESGRISTAILQRRLCIGYGRAAMIIDRLEELGVISAPNGTQPRALLLTKQEIDDRFKGTREGK